MRTYGRRSFIEIFVPIFIGTVAILTLASVVVSVIIGVKIIANPEETVQGIGKLVKIFMDAVQ